MQALFNFTEMMLQAARHGIFADLNPFQQNAADGFHLRPAVCADHVHVDAVAGF